MAIKLLCPDEVPEGLRRFCDFDSQYLFHRESWKGRGTCIKITCPICGEKRDKWAAEVRAAIRRGQAGERGEWTAQCNSCSLHILTKERYEEGKLGNMNHPNWKTGRCQNYQGYILRHKATFSIAELSIMEPMFPKRGYIPEHRAVMALHLGRSLKFREVIHHKNGIKDDNRLENLEILPSKENMILGVAANAEVIKWKRAFYRAVGLWLAERVEKAATVRKAAGI